MTFEEISWNFFQLATFSCLKVLHRSFGWRFFMLSWWIYWVCHPAAGWDRQVLLWPEIFPPEAHSVGWRCPALCPSAHLVGPTHSKQNQALKKIAQCLKTMLMHLSVVFGILGLPSLTSSFSLSVWAFRTYRLMRRFMIFCGFDELRTRTGLMQVMREHASIGCHVRNELWPGIWLDVWSVCSLCIHLECGKVDTCGADTENKHLKNVIHSLLGN